MCNNPKHIHIFDHPTDVAGKKRKRSNTPTPSGSKKPRQELEDMLDADHVSETDSEAEQRIVIKKEKGVADCIDLTSPHKA